MIGLGFYEVTTFTISNPQDEFHNLNLPLSKMVEIANPVGEEYSGLRVGLLPSLLKILRENRRHPLPQQIFELGIIVDEQGKNHYHLGGIRIDARANFTECKSLVEAVLRDIGVSFSLHEQQHPAFVSGRCASVRQGEKELGFFGEVHPRTIQTFDLEHPTIAFEFFVDSLQG
jgi:phenylalanyl-tRNA synthetase beta chain